MSLSLPALSWQLISNETFKWTIKTWRSFSKGNSTWKQYPFSQTHSLMFCVRNKAYLNFILEAYLDTESVRQVICITSVPQQSTENMIQG